MRRQDIRCATMDGHAINQAATAEVLGITQGLMSKILKGERSLPKDSIRPFCAEFKIGVDAMH